MTSTLRFLPRDVRLAAAGLALALGLGGCMTPAVDDPARIGPFFTPTNFAGDARLPANLRRVVLLPICGGAIAPKESVAALDAVFLAELQKQNRFEVVVLTREECLHRFHVEEFASTAALPHDFVSDLRRDFAADGVMFVDLTTFKAYRPLALGVRAKLAAIGGGSRFVWTFDNIFAASDPAVAASARHYFLGSDRRDVPADLTPATLQSPTRFAAYVAAATFATLPPVNAPATVR
jgi:hypothetical protein